MTGLTSRQNVTEPGTDPKRRAAALRASADLEAFTARLQLVESTESVCLYLAHLQALGKSGHVIRRRLHYLDVARGLEGLAPWTSDPDLHLFLRGLHQRSPLTTQPRGHPLYRELVAAMVDSTMHPTDDQRSWRAAILLANATGASTLSLLALRWADISFVGTVMRLQWRGASEYKRGWIEQISRHDSPRPYDAMRDLWTRAPDRSGVVFVSRLGPMDNSRFDQRFPALPAFSRRARARPRLSDIDLDPILCDVMQPTLKQLRDRALILVGFAAALRTFEATGAKTGWFHEDERGLLIDTPLRREVTAVEALGGPYCPVEAWRQWIVELRRLERHESADPAFPRIRGREVGASPLGENGLNRLVALRAKAAGLEDDYKFTNLRDGWIRDALRAGAPAHDIAAHADLRSLAAVAKHEKRENLLRDNIAGRLGL